jgi:hypothetical protein
MLPYRRVSAEQLQSCLDNPQQSQTKTESHKLPKPVLSAANERIPVHGFEYGSSDVRRQAAGFSGNQAPKIGCLNGADNWGMPRRHNPLYFSRIEAGLSEGSNASA